MSLKSRWIAIALLLAMTSSKYLHNEENELKMDGSMPRRLPMDALSRQKRNGKGAFMSNKALLSQQLIDFPWSDFSISYDKALQNLVDLLVIRVLEEPEIRINENCIAESLKKVTSSDCLAYPNAFSGQVRDEFNQIKVAHAIQLGFDADTLEILLHELFDVVDIFFIIESTKTNYKYTQKPLIWERLKQTNRFKQFNEKVVHLILDDSEFSNFVPQNQAKEDESIWEVESKQERFRWIKFKEWNENNQNYFSPNDIIAFGDADEVPTRQNVHLLKQCVWKDVNNPIDVGIWFPFGNLSNAFGTDWPVPSHPFTLGDPTYFTISSIGKDDAPNRNRGTSGRYILGGMHLTNHYFLPHYLIKHLTCTECVKSGKDKFEKIIRLMNETTVDNVGEDIMNALEWDKSGERRVINWNKTENVNKDDWQKIVKIPWFLERNSHTKRCAMEKMTLYKINTAIAH